MKKQILILSTLFFLLLGNTFSQTVYLTKTGEKYHTQTCRYLKKSSSPINLNDALAQGYQACKVCHPPSNAQASPTNVGSTTKKEEHSGETKQATQCSAITKAGERCKRTTKSSNGKCWQHGGT